MVAEIIWRRKPDRYLLLRYEDFVSDPKRALEQILEFVEEAPLPLPLVDESTVRLAPTHSVSGNPSRFKTGTVELRDDREWVHEMRTVDRLFVTALTSPLLRRYGYRLR